MALSQRAKNLAATGLFKQYAARFVFRACVFAYAIYLFVFDPEQLNISQYFGLPGGFNPVDFFFLCIFADIFTKFLPEANLAMGSLKQYRRYQVPTFRTFQGGRKGFMEFIQKIAEEGKIALTGSSSEEKKEALDEAVHDVTELVSETVEDAGAFLEAKTGNAVNALGETATGVIDLGTQILRDIGLMRLLPFEQKDLTADEELRDQIRRDREKEVIPVVIFWIVFNLIIGFALHHFGILNEQTILMWVLFYFLFDMICVIFWCPLQLFLMRNRCCTTCQIFNWDAIMTTTPLFIILIATPFAWILVLLSLIVLVRWELAFIRHPERFDDRTNASLRCAHCKDKLCYLRAPLDVKREAPNK